MLARVLLAAVAVGGCHDHVALEPPPSIEGGSVLLFSREGERPPRLHVSNVSGSLPALAYRELDLRAVSYRCPAEVYGLLPGVQQLLPTPEVIARMPPSDRIAASSVEGDRQTEWMELETLDEPYAVGLRSLQLPEEYPCQTYAPPYTLFRGRRELTPFSPATFALAIGADSALIGTEDGRFFVATESASQVDIRDVSLSTSNSTVTPSDAAFMRDDGEIWLWGRDGRLARGTLEGGFSLVPARTATSARPNGSIAGSRGNAPFELYVLTGDGVLGRYDGEAWTELHRGYVPRRRCGEVGSGVVLPRLAWIGPGEVIATGATDFFDRVVRYRDGQTFEQSVPSVRGDDWPTSVAHLPGIGAVVGTCRGYLVAERDGELVQFSEKPQRGGIRTIARLGPGLIYTAGTLMPNFGRFHPAVGYCGIEVVEIANLIAELPGSNGVLLVHASEIALEVSLVRLIEETPECLLR